MRSDIIAITETWMNEASIVNLDGFEMVNSSNKPIISREIAASNDSVVQISSRFDCSTIRGDVSDRRMIRDASLGFVSLNGQNKFIMAVIYIHPNASKSNIELFLLHALSDYTGATGRLISTAAIDI